MVIYVSYTYILKLLTAGPSVFLFATTIFLMKQDWVKESILNGFDTISI